jgi:ATP/maltotriose-dependent transcriptional regulator MalT
VAAGDAYARLGEVRRRQGRLDEARALFDDVFHHPLALLGQANIALDQGEPAAAADLVERFFRNVFPDDRAARVFAAEPLVRALLATGRRTRVPDILREVQATVAAVGSDALRASAAQTHGLWAQAEGDLEAARRSMEDAVDHFARCDGPYEAARARMDLAGVLKALGRVSTARTEAEAALSALTRLGAALEAQKASRFLAEVNGGVAPVTADPSGLTAREVDVLRLVALGRSNQEIAETLVLSTRTVERHISTIYTKLEVSGKAARATATAYAIRHGLLPAHS